MGPEILSYSRPRGHPRRLHFPFGYEELVSEIPDIVSDVFDRVENQALANRPPAGVPSTISLEKKASVVKQMLLLFNLWPFLLLRSSKDHY